MCSTKRKKQETARSKRARSSSTSVTAEMEIDGESAAGDGGAQGRRQSNGGDSNAGAASASAVVAVAAKVVGAAPIGLPTHRLFNLKPAAMQLESKLVVQEFPRSGELEQGRGGGGRGDWGGTNAVDANASSTAAGATPLPITALESRALEAKQKQKQKQKRKRSRSAERDDTDSRIFHLTRRAHDFVRRVNRSFEVEEESAQRLAAAAVVEPGGYAENKQMLLSNVMRDFAKGACDVSTVRTAHVSTRRRAPHFFIHSTRTAPHTTLTPLARTSLLPSHADNRQREALARQPPRADERVGGPPALVSRPSCY